MRSWNVLAFSLAIGCTALTALGQDGKPKGAGADQPPPARVGEGPGRGPGAGPRGPAMSPEASKAAWELEAAGVAKRLGLTDDQTKTLVKAYADARESHQAAGEKLRQELVEKAAGNPDGAREMREGVLKSMTELQNTEKEKFQKALGSTLSADQTTKVMASLGAFNRQWDMIVDKIAGFKLDPAKQQDALNAAEDFMAAQTKARAALTGENPDREAMRNAMLDSRQKFLDEMKKVLTPDQLIKIEESMGRGQGGQRGGGGGGPN